MINSCLHYLVPLGQEVDMPVKVSYNFYKNNIVLLQVVGPSDGSAYVIPYFGAGVSVVRSSNETYLLPQADWHNIT